MWHNRRSRYSEFLDELEFTAFKTVGKLVILVLLAYFALKEIVPVLRAILALFRSP